MMTIAKQYFFDGFIQQETLTTEFFLSSSYFLSALICSWPGVLDAATP